MKQPEVGQVAFRREFQLGREELIAYAGASGDHNPIHWSDRIAAEAGLPGVLAHGMLTQGITATTVQEWAGPQARVESLSARFSRPVVVPEAGQAVVVVEGTVREVDAGRVVLDLEVTHEDVAVLSKATATVRLMSSQGFTDRAEPNGE